MNSMVEESVLRACWFVGAAHGGTNDQTARFLGDGIWENGYQDRYLDLVKSIRPGDRIAIKSAYTRKHKLPFDNRGHTVSVMAIKAVGTVIENLGDGRRLKVNWVQPDSPREWYFYTSRLTVWKVLPGDWYTDALIAFTFEGKPQDVNQFRNEPYWRERFGDVAPNRRRFNWARFYEAMAEKLLDFQQDRTRLVGAIHDIAGHVEGLSNLQDQFTDGTSGPLKDICPFTVMGIFNRGITDANRKTIAKRLAAFLGVEEAIPETFEGIPILNNQASWFFGYARTRGPDDIDALWTVFAEAIRFADTDDPDARSAFITAYDTVTQVRGVGWNLTMGLYWTRPWDYPTLDSQSQFYITKKLGIAIGRNGPKKRCDAQDYLAVLDALEVRFREDTYPVHSFPELSLAAWQYRDAGGSPQSGDVAKDTDEEDVVAEVEIPPESYSADDILAEGCFMGRVQVEKLLDRLRMKKNLILQGPPGTGKTWLARRLAFAWVGQRDDSRVRAVQFHPNLSYEDFVRGWRPTGDGKLTLVDGPFMEMVSAASRAPALRHVLVIEEINRGNPAQIFGEMLTLLETDKRSPAEAMELCYRRAEGERVFIPDNLYIIGTMNIADRSLALVDLALRRRFAFIDLEPQLGDTWRNWVHGKSGIDLDILSEIERKIVSLNEIIAADPSLGSQFQIGHSYVTPPFGVRIDNAREWFRQVVATEIGPLLDEYWFDAIDKAREAQKHLIAGF